MTPFDGSGKEAFWKHCGKKEKLLVQVIFSFSYNVFYSIKHRNYKFCYIWYVVCKYFQFGPVQNSDVRERVNPLFSLITTMELQVRSENQDTGWTFPYRTMLIKIRLHVPCYLILINIVRKSSLSPAHKSMCFNPFPHNNTFWRPWETSLLKTLWEKEKLLVTSNFSFTHSVFYPFRELSAIFIKSKIVVCRLFQFGPV